MLGYGLTFGHVRACTLPHIRLARLLEKVNLHFSKKDASKRSSCAKVNFAKNLLSRKEFFFRLVLGDRIYGE
ncbi:MAG: hypothetical protein A2007_04985 [Verrucomicrobia bacterium GWC2_42_7]|nr:MAG: hypothetical protein A2007_04985 [Verrucomicrobia bacterium GWC2_42_7]